MSPVDEAASVMAVTLLHKAYEHLPAERVAGAVSLANLEPLEKAIAAIALEAYSAGLDHGIKRGRAELEKAMEDDWKPIAQRIRGQANSPSYSVVEQLQAESRSKEPEYTGGPVEAW